MVHGQDEDDPDDPPSSHASQRFMDTVHTHTVDSTTSPVKFLKRSPLSTTIFWNGQATFLAQWHDFSRYRFTCATLRRFFEEANLAVT